MPRLPRLRIANVPQHVIQRGNNREVCFFDEIDYQVYLSKLKEYGLKYEVKIHAYVLMTNHVHLLMTPAEVDGVSRLMQALGRYYVRYINNTYGRTGTLWEGRYKSTLVGNEHYFLVVSRYIELNPVRADMVNEPWEYPWSSYQHNGVGRTIELITFHDCYLALGKDREEQMKAYCRLFDEYLSEDQLKEIRDSTNKSWLLGDNHFKQQIEVQTGRRVGPLARGGDRKSAVFKKKVNKG